MLWSDATIGEWSVRIAACPAHRCTAFPGHAGRRIVAGVTPRSYARWCADPRHRHRSGRRRARRPGGGRAVGQAGPAADTRHDHRPDEHRRRDGPPRPRAPRRRGGDRRPHPVPRRRAARRRVLAGRRPQAGVHPGRRPRRQAGAGPLAGPLRPGPPPPVDGRRPARPLPRAARRRADGAHRAGPHASWQRAGAGRRRGGPAPGHRLVRRGRPAHRRSGPGEDRAAGAHGTRHRLPAGAVAAVGAPVRRGHRRRRHHRAHRRADRRGGRRRFGRPAGRRPHRSPASRATASRLPRFDRRGVDDGCR